jgi:small-conductance mechanosensitive channel
MNILLKKILAFTLFAVMAVFMAGADTIPDSSRIGDNRQIKEFLLKMNRLEEQRIQDSMQKASLEIQIGTLRTTDNIRKARLMEQLEALQTSNEQRNMLKKTRIDSMKARISSYPVTGILGDTLFRIYARSGALQPKERAGNITRRIRKLYDDDFMAPDSIRSQQSDYTTDVVYGEAIILSLSETDGMFENTAPSKLADTYVQIIRDDIRNARQENSLKKLLVRIMLTLLVISIAGLLLWLAGKGYLFLKEHIAKNREKWLRDLVYKDYTFLNAEQELKVVLFLLKILKWLAYAILLYISIPIIFSIFPFTRGWADDLLNVIWNPFRGIMVGVWNYFPNLASILVIYFVMKYFIRFVKYLFSEIESGKLNFSGFHSDWAMPTYSIVRFLLYAFMFVMIFPFLPGSDSDIFKGVSVFIGILFSLGSSSAIANMVAGLVITYMRPFRIGDRIKIGDISGDVVEKTLLVTRLRTPKNEEITIPNASVLTGNTTNYTSYAREDGLILHTTVTIGYDVPWKNIHQALLLAADRTEGLLKTPNPFVLQTSLDDFYVAYQINAYTRESGRQAFIYSQLHQNIQDCCSESGIEILSPHYRAARDGNASTIPAPYLPSTYVAPPFKVKFEKNTDNE